MKLHLLSFLGMLGVACGQPRDFSDCDADIYYSTLAGNPASWSRADLHPLLQSTHREILPFTTPNEGGFNDVWGAVGALDIGGEPDSVRLVYTQEDIPKIPFGVRGWEKEHLWPTERGIGTTGPDYTDIHNIKPENMLSQTVRADKYFGACGVLVRDETCETPAQGGPPDTCSCNRLYEPPMNVRGDIARALMYMDLRYDGSDVDTVDLTLTDCPFNPETDMAYLSQMLTWHIQDPPDAREVIRNQQACRFWQGNRNPFIDFPELAQSLYGTPLPLPAVGERLIYPACELLTTFAPTPTPNVCDIMEPGDIHFFLLNSVDPDNVGLFTFVDIPADFDLYLTDNAWTGSQWLSNEGVIKVNLSL